MKEEAIKKINKMGKVSHILSVVAKVFLIIGLVCSIIGTVAVIVLPDDLIKVSLSGEAGVEVNLESFDVKFTEAEKNELKEDMLEDEKDFDIDGVEYEIGVVDIKDSSFDILAKAEVNEFTLRDTWVIMLMTSVTLAMSIIMIIFVDKLCLAIMNCSTPFEENVIKRLQNLAYVLIPWTLISSFAEGVIEGFLSGESGGILAVDLKMIIAVLLILAIAYIFKYGAVLQQESDETL